MSSLVDSLSISQQICSPNNNTEQRLDCVSDALQSVRFDLFSDGHEHLFCAQLLLPRHASCTSRISSRSP
jgi:hypothetical protein